MRSIFHPFRQDGFHCNKNGFVYGQIRFYCLARQLGFEPKTYGLEVRCSIQLGYWRKWSG